MMLSSMHQKYQGTTGFEQFPRLPVVTTTTLTVSSALFVTTVPAQRTQLQPVTATLTTAMTKISLI